MKQVRCKSGLRGWRSKLREIYASQEEFESYSELYGLAQRLGYRSAKVAWRANPTVEGSTNPEDYRRVSK